MTPSVSMLPVARQPEQLWHCQERKKRKQDPLKPPASVILGHGCSRFIPPLRAAPPHEVDMSYHKTSAFPPSSSLTAHTKTKVLVEIPGRNRKMLPGQ